MPQGWLRTKKSTKNVATVGMFGWENMCSRSLFGRTTYPFGQCNEQTQNWPSQWAQSADQLARYRGTWWEMMWKWPYLFRRTLFCTIYCGKVMVVGGCVFIYPDFVTRPTVHDSSQWNLLTDRSFQRFYDCTTTNLIISMSFFSGRCQCRRCSGIVLLEGASCGKKPRRPCFRCKKFSRHS